MIERDIGAVILEPRLNSRVGHYYQQTIALVRAYTKLKIQLHLYTDVNISTDIINEFSSYGVNVFPFFRERRWDRTRVRDVKWLLRSLNFLSHLRQVSPQLKKNTPILMPSGEIELLLGVVLAIKAGWWPHRICIRFFEWDRRAENPGIRFFPGGLATVTEKLTRSCLPEQIVIVGDSDQICSEISEILQRNVPELPQPIEWTSDAVREKDAVRPVVSMIGELRDEKGFDQFSDALPLLKTKLKLEVQAGPNKHADENLRRCLVSRVKSMDGIVHEYNLSPADYWAAMGRSGIVVCPYRPNLYKRRTSGIVIDAIGSGSVPVVPEGTWLSSMVRSYGVGETYQPYTAKALSKTIDHVQENWDSYRQASAAIASRVRDDYSPGHVAKLLLSCWNNPKLV